MHERAQKWISPPYFSKLSDFILSIDRFPLFMLR
jgi:hypothetical protein